MFLKCPQVVKYKKKVCVVKMTYAGTATTSQNENSHISKETLLNTLNEPILDTVLRDVCDVGKKFKYVLSSKARSEYCAGLRDWDLWGPLILCIFLSIFLLAKTDNDQKKLLFSLTLTIIWVGATMITVNAVLLGGVLSFFHSICVIGYFLLPLDIAAFLCTVLPQSFALLKIVTLVAAVLWSSLVSSAFMSRVTPGEKQKLAMFPLYLFYSILAWIIFIA